MIRSSHSSPKVPINISLGIAVQLLSEVSDFYERHSLLYSSVS